MTEASQDARAYGRRFTAQWRLTAILALALAAALSLGQLVRPLDNLLYDSAVSLAGRATPDDIVIVAIDDRSLAAIGRWPWPRDVHAALLRRLAQSKPAAVIYDVLFTEPQPAQDPALAQAIAACGHVYLPLLLTTPGADGAPYAAARPVEPIAGAAAAVGQVNIHPDADGVVRRAFLVESDGVHAWPHLTGMAFEALHGALPLMDRAIVPGPAQPALERRGEMLIPYAGPAGHMRAVSFVDVLNGQLPDAFLRGKTVFIGATAAGLADRFPTPVGGASSDMSGVEIQANMLDGLERGAVARPAGPLGSLLFSLVPTAILLTAFLKLRPRANAALGAGLLVATLGASALALSLLHLWFAPGAALAGLALAWPLWAWRRLEASSAYMLEELDRLQGEPGLLEQAPKPAPGGDVVERQLALMRLQVARVRDLRRFAADALAGLPDATFLVSLEGAILSRSRTAEPFLASLGLTDEADMAAVFAKVQAPETLTLGAPPHAQASGPDGALYQLDQAAIRAHDGAPRGWIVRFGDVTAIRRAQDEREEVLQLLTHDMRSPQASILALIDTPASETPGSILARISALARRTLNLADGYVQLSRAQSAPLALETLDAGDLLVEAADAVWPQAHAKGVRLEAEPPPHELPIDADRSLLGRALINLIDNAVRHAPTGSVVTCSVRADGDLIAFTVEDRGEGLATDQAATLFDRFAAGKRSPGAGLGLALVQATATRHGGLVWCQSAPGQGARFVLSVPGRS